MWFSPTRLTEDETRFRRETRSTLVDLGSYSSPTMLGMTGPEGHNAEFSRRLGALGLIGLTLPVEVGGHGQTFVKRFVLTEELLVAQAPVSAHWFADRQSAPLIARYGSSDQRQRFIPPIVAGECFFSIGMSEPDAGSDLARLRTLARRVDGGWIVNGTKVWTTLAHRNHWMILLCRTDTDAERHAGLSQFIVDLSSPGVSISPIETLDGEGDFCEVVLTDVFVPAELLLGAEGGGWDQVVGELAFERSGPDRYLSVFTLLADLVRTAPPGSAEMFGRLVARYRIVRELALSIARALDEGRSPVAEAALMKDIGTVLEQDTVEAARLWLEIPLDPWSDDPRSKSLARAVLMGPSFTLRGGTTEILRGVVARTVGNALSADRDPVNEAVSKILADTAPTELVRATGGAFAEAAWEALAHNGLVTAAIDVDHGGFGGSIRDAATVVRSCAATAAPLPIAETALVAGPALAAADVVVGARPITVALEHNLVLTQGRLTGMAWRVPFASDSEKILAVVDDRLVTFAGGGASRGLSGEPREDVRCDEVAPESVMTSDIDVFDLGARLAAGRVVQIAGAVEAVLALTARHAATREQFGAPLIKLQAVAHQVALLAECEARASIAAELAVRWLEGSTDRADLACAVVTSRECATLASRLAHQVHGAMGIAAEGDLQLFTRRLWTWRDECGAERAWAIELGTFAKQAPDLWDWLSR
jgi:alkylation response protein AidB-like acyl-CoA dehydrogenase